MSNSYISKRYIRTYIVTNLKWPEMYELSAFVRSHILVKQNATYVRRYPVVKSS